MSTFLQPPPKPQPPPNNPGGGVFDDFPVDRQSCQLLGPTALVVQGLMGMVVITSLLLKRHREKPKRPWRICGHASLCRLFDVSKQVVGQMFVHGVNVLISDVGSTRSSRNACVFYFINILIDTTLGVGAIYLTLHFLTWFFTEKLQLRGFQSGQYGSPPSLNYWLRQAVVYVVSLTSMKLLVVLLLAYWHGLVDIGVWLLSWLGNGNTAQVVFTMGLFPIFMNVVQFWLIDSIVKAGGIYRR
ncbi:vacuolar membrane protein-domain-containing protein [Multifurca ochricompacta]|uniref:Vacuolar membrane protein-domain-containing protein n=1 Tax=Multifurca ochricompacta TaxID=376703 RepID=A0AAD4M4H3_9AGAM|nr:vacuolar membrane protein-domain-containing protein [Multifurca ochricompacta]